MQTKLGIVYIYKFIFLHVFCWFFKLVNIGIKIAITRMIAIVRIMQGWLLFSCAGAATPLASMTLASATPDRYVRWFMLTYFRCGRESLQSRAELRIAHQRNCQVKYFEIN